MTETLTYETLTGEVAKQAAKSVTDELIPRIYELVPEDTVKALNKILNGIADDPERYSKALSNIFQQRTQNPQMRPPATDAHFVDKNSLNRPTAARPEPDDAGPANETRRTDNEKFHYLYDEIVKMLEMMTIRADPQLSEILATMKEKPDETKSLIRPFFDEFMRL